MQEITKTLEERGKTHGDFSDNAKISQELKHAIRIGVRFTDLSDIQREALDMICHKISRIVSGNPNEPDHWRDIAGYATLVEQRLIHTDEEPEGTITGMM